MVAATSPAWCPPAPSRHRPHTEIGPVDEAVLVMVAHRARVARCRRMKAAGRHRAAFDRVDGGHAQSAPSAGVVASAGIKHPHECRVVGQSVAREGAARHTRRSFGPPERPAARVDRRVDPRIGRRAPSAAARIRSASSSGARSLSTRGEPGLLRGDEEAAIVAHQISRTSAAGAIAASVSGKWRPTRSTLGIHKPSTASGPQIPGAKANDQIGASSHAATQLVAQFRPARRDPLLQPAIPGIDERVRQAVADKIAARWDLAVKADARSRAATSANGPDAHRFGHRNSFSTPEAKGLSTDPARSTNVAWWPPTLNVSR